jgi:hypothetical protein
MTTLVPIRYSDKSNSTFFDVAGLLITIDYEVSSHKRMFVLPGSVTARVEAKLGGDSTIGHEYEIPRSLRVGGEIGHLERGLYGFMDELVRSAVQKKALESAEKEVEAAEAEHLFFEGSLGLEAEREKPSARLRGQAAEQARLLDDLVGHVLNAVRHLTNVTSLTRDGLEAYQRDRSQALQEVVQSTSMTASVRVHDVLQGAEAFLRYEAEGTTDVKVLRERTLDYLEIVERRHKGPGLALTNRQAYVIVNEFVPEFVQMKLKYDAAVSFPKDVVGHAFGSFFGGGIAGWFTLSVLGEAVIRGLTGTYVDVPGFYIGAAVAFVWPYLSAVYGAFTREEGYERRRRALLKKTSDRLELALPEDV